MTAAVASVPTLGLPYAVSLLGWEGGLIALLAGGAHMHALRMRCAPVEIVISRVPDNRYNTICMQRCTGEVTGWQGCFSDIQTTLPPRVP